VVGILPGATWASLGGFDTALVDKGGAYRTRALTMSAVAVVGALSALVGTLAGAMPWIAVPLMLVWGTGSGLARVLGMAGASVGTLSMSIFLIALSAPPHTAGEGAMRVLLLIGGALWAMALALFLWPLRPYRPLRMAVAEVYRLLALNARALAQGGSEDDIAERGGHGLRAQMREALEAARIALASHRRGRPGESGRGERLLVLIEAADQCWGYLTALRDVRAGVVSADAPAPDASAALTKLLNEFADSADAVAVVTETDGPPIPSERIPRVGWDASSLRAAVDGMQGLARSRWERVLLILERLRQQETVAMEVAASINGEAPVDITASLLERLDARWPRGTRRRAQILIQRSIVAPLRANLTLDSVVMRHALRLGITMAAAELVGRLFHMHRAYWVTRTVLVILQPYSGATFIRAVQRMVGTVLGAILAALIGAAIHNPVGVLVVVFVLAAVCVAVLPLNYGAFSVFLTPTFVLLAEVNAGDWHLAPIRVANTLLGGVLALAGSSLLWPDAEREGYTALMAAALAAVRRLLRTTIDAYRDPKALAGLGDARREVGLAIANAEATLPGLLAHPGRSHPKLEAYMVFTTYMRRLAAAIVALAVGADAEHAATTREHVERFGSTADSVLAELERAALGERAPAGDSASPLRAETSDGVDPVLNEQLERVARPVRVLWGAVERVGVGS